MTTDLFVSIVATSATPNKIGGGTITIPETAQAVVGAGKVVGTAGKVITLPALGTGGAKAMLIASGVGNNLKDSDKNDKNTTETSKNNSKDVIKQKELEQEIKSFEEISKGKPTQIDTRNIGATETSKNAIEIKVTKDKMKEIKKIAEEGDLSGIKTEKVFDSVLKDQPNVKVYDGKVGSNNGFDHVYAITDDKGAIKEVWIVDSKQMGSTKRLKEGAVKLNNNATKLGDKTTRQLSPDWIEADLAKLDENNPIIKIVEEAKANKTLRTGVVAVNRESKKLMFIEVTVANK